MCIMRVWRRDCSSTMLCESHAAAAHLLSSGCASAAGAGGTLRGTAGSGNGSTSSGMTLRPPPPAGRKPGAGASWPGRPIVPPASALRAVFLERCACVGFRAGGGRTAGAGGGRCAAALRGVAPGAPGGGRADADGPALCGGAPSSGLPPGSALFSERLGEAPGACSGGAPSGRAAAGAALSGGAMATRKTIGRVIGPCRFLP